VELRVGRRSLITKFIPIFMAPEKYPGEMDFSHADAGTLRNRLAELDSWRLENRSDDSIDDEMRAISDELEKRESAP